eukprot:1195136-Prorocentrum_minimum.AAC.4
MYRSSLLTTASYGVTCPLYHEIGYLPVNPGINASDDRSAGGLCRKVADAVEFQPVMGDRRPNCVVIDEIDGVAGLVNRDLRKRQRRASLAEPNPRNNRNTI